jgi:lipoate-protein ligase B
VVAYPILDLTQAPHRKDLHWYWHALEGAAIDCLGTYGLSGERDPAGTGVWVGGKKIAALGLTASRWITMHGLSLNADPDLGAEGSGFGGIVPCGIEGRGVTSVARELRAARAASHVADAHIGLFLKGPAEKRTADVRARLVAALAKSFALNLHEGRPSPGSLEGDGSADNNAALWVAPGEGPGLGTPESDDGHLDDAAWLAKHQRPI